MKQQQDKIPLFKTWKAWYAFVLIILVLLIIGFYLFTKNFA